MSESISKYVARKLREDGYDGLAGEDCGCGVDDLMPCCEPWTDCTPAYKWTCSTECPLEGDPDTSGCEFFDPLAPNDGCYRTTKQTKEG